MRRAAVKIQKYLIPVVMAAAFCLSARAAPAQETPLPIGNAEIAARPDAVYMRLRAPKNFNAAYGLFRFARESGKWETIGTAASYSGPAPIGENLIPPDELFYPRTGYREVSLGGGHYRIDAKDNRILVAVSGGAAGEYVSEEQLPPADGRRAYRFLYLTAGRLWFDLRIEREGRQYSEGVGFFDIKTQRIELIAAEKLAPGAKAPIVVTELSGNRNSVWVGLAVCKDGNCLDSGLVVMLGTDGEPARRLAAGEKGLPAGAVIRAAPDGDSIWIATSAGLALIGPDQIQTFQISREVRFDGALIFGLNSSENNLPAPSDFAPSSGRIEAMENDSFLIKTGVPLKLWISREDAGSVALEEGAIDIGPGKPARFHTAPDPQAPFSTFSHSLNETLQFKITGEQSGWLQANLSDYAWFASGPVVISIVETGLFPSNGFVGQKK